MGSVSLSACQKEEVQPLPEVVLPAGSPFVLVQPQPALPPDKAPKSQYIGILTGIVPVPGHLVVAGYQGTILRYSVATRKWTREISPVHGDFYGMAISPSGDLWIAGDRGVLLKSKDGGVHWDSVSTNVAPLFLNAVTFPVSGTGYAVGEKGVIIKTVDGGAHWRRLSSPTGKNLYGIAFSDEKHGVIAGWHKTLLTTVDGGDHFLSVDLPVQKISRQKPSLNSVWNHGNQYLVAGDHGLLFRSTDNGKSFVQIETDSLHDLYGVCQTGRGAIALAGEQGELLFLEAGPAGSWKKTRPLGDFHGADWLGISCGTLHVRVSGSKGSILLPKTGITAPSK
jgi:photosystem II stability/assembly factor-like uncharacterized protein